MVPVVAVLSTYLTRVYFPKSSSNFANLNVGMTGVDAADVKLGDNLKMNLNLNRQENAQNDITYLVRDVLHLRTVCVSWSTCCAACNLCITGCTRVE